MTEYVLWYKTANSDSSRWAPMSYHPACLHVCEARLDHYQEQWGNHYRYRIEPVGYIPEGSSMPIG